MAEECISPTCQLCLPLTVLLLTIFFVNWRAGVMAVGFCIHNTISWKNLFKEWGSMASEFHSKQKNL